MKWCLIHVLSPYMGPQPLGVMALLANRAVLFLSLDSLQNKLIFCVLHVFAEVHPSSLHPFTQHIMLVLCFFDHLIWDGDLLYSLGSSSRWLRKGYILPLPVRTVAYQVLFRVGFWILLGEVKPL